MFTDVMVDLETTGANFDHNAVIQIAAVKFNYDTEDVSPDFFNACLSIPPKRYWDEGTRQWWSRNPAHILKGIQAAARPPEEVIREFYHWLLKDYPNGQEGLRFWGKPTHFDYSFIASYFEQYGLTNPCHFRDARDLNSFVAGLSGSPQKIPFEKEIEFEGDEHNALHDTLFQLKALFTVKKRFQSVEVIHAS